MLIKEYILPVDMMTRADKARTVVSLRIAGISIGTNSPNVQYQNFPSVIPPNTMPVSYEIMISVTPNFPILVRIL